MKIKLTIVLFLFTSLKICAAELFFCVDGPLRIRSNPNLTSSQVGSLNTFEIVPVLEKTGIVSVIDNLSDNWYKIKKEGIEGYVFGGYGIIIKDEYSIHSINDIAKLLPEKFTVNSETRSLYIYGNDNIPMVRLSYEIAYLNNSFYLSIYYRPRTDIDTEEIAKTMNLKIGNYNSTFGMGSSHSLLLDSKFSDEIITDSGDRGRYYFRSWGSSWTYDIAAFLFERQFNDNFNGLIISLNNIWTNKNDSRIMSITNQYIRDAKSNSVKESIIYQLFYEIIKRYHIILETER